MLWSLLFVTLLLCLGLKADPIANLIQDESTLQKIESVIKSRCLRNADYNAFSEFKGAADDLNSCMEQNLQPPTNAEEEKNYICVQIRQTSSKCIKNVLEKLEPCLNLEERYLPHVLLSFHNSTFDIQCKNGGKVMQDFMSILGSAKCDPSIEYMREVLVENCLPKMQLLKNLINPDYILKQSDLCSELETAKECIITEVKSHCSNDADLVGFLITFFHKYLSLCGGDISVNLID